MFVIGKAFVLPYSEPVLAAVHLYASLVGPNYLGGGHPLSYCFVGRCGRIGTSRT